MTKTTKNTKPALTAEEFQFFMGASIGNTMGKEFSKEEQARLDELGLRTTTVADALNISIATTQLMLQNGIQEMASILVNSLDTSHILQEALIENGTIDSELIDKTAKRYYDNVRKQEEALEKQALEKQKIAEEGLELKVVKNESEVDLSVKG